MNPALLFKQTNQVKEWEGGRSAGLRPRGKELSGGVDFGFIDENFIDQSEGDWL
jgi:hypothetical protein